MSIWEAFGMGRHKGFSREAGLLLDEAVELAGSMGCARADTGHLLLAMLQTDRGPAGRFLAGKNITEPAVRRQLAEGRTSPARQLDRKVLQQTEAAGRLGQCVLPDLRLSHGHVIKRGNFGKQRNKLPFSLFHRVHSKRCFSTSQSRLGLSCVSSSVHVACGESASSRERSPAISITPSKSAACRSRAP